LVVDAGERRRELAQVIRGEAGELAETPVRQCDGCLGVRQHQRQPLGIVAVRLDANGGARLCPRRPRSARPFMDA
jgi:hypothetical protein